MSGEEVCGSATYDSAADYDYVSLVVGSHLRGLRWLRGI